VSDLVPSDLIDRQSLRPFEGPTAIDGRAVAPSGPTRRGVYATFKGWRPASPRRCR
jgi:hypothetical protein